MENSPATRFVLEKVQYMPKQLNAGILYVAEEFGAVAHLCACGCGTKIRTPLWPAKWTLEETDTGPSLYPSVGNWQHACQSHYWITNGEVIWEGQWTPEQIEAGRLSEQMRLEAYYSEVKTPRSIIRRIWDWISRRAKI
jgi:hypothetical protein